MRPLLLLDIYGVLNPLVREAPGFTAYRMGGMPVLLNPDHGRWLCDLADLFEITWASSWERDADLVAAKVGLPLGLPYLAFTHTDGWAAGDDWLNKLPAVSRFVGNRPLAWVDDVFDAYTREWAASRGVPTLLVETDCRVGLTGEHIERLRAFVS
jgi:hypothetical protein